MKGDNIMISKRIGDINESPTRKLIPYANMAKEKGKNIFQLNIGQPDLATPKEFFERIGKFSDKTLAYALSQGIPELVEGIRRYFERQGLSFEKNEIMITTGGSEALLFSMMVLCDPGDEILVPEPFYTNYLTFSRMINVNLVPIETNIEDSFHLPSKEKIEALISKKTKAILITNPGNPTGVVYSEEELKMIDEIVNDNELFLISDEVYRDYIYDGLKYISIANITKSDKYVLIDSISKKYSACGARIGMIACKNQEFLKQFLKLCQSRLASPTMEQYAAVALFNMTDEYIEETKVEYQKRRDVLMKCLSEIPGVKYSNAKGAFYTMAKLPVENAEEFIIWMVSNYDIDGNTLLLTPCENFYVTKGKGLNEVRIAYVIESEKLIKSMEILKGALEEYKK